MQKLSINDCVFLCMRNGDWWTFWDLQKTIKLKTGKFYGEPSISASIRELRKSHARDKYNLPKTGEIVERKKISGGKGYKYKLIPGS